MTTLKLIGLAVIFVVTSGAVFSDYFKKHKTISFFAAIVAIISTYYLFKSIYLDLVDNVALGVRIEEENRKQTAQEKVDSSAAQKSLLREEQPVVNRVQTKEATLNKELGVRLSKVSQSGNDITDYEKWVGYDAIQSLTYKVPNPFFNSPGDLPGVVPDRYKENFPVKVFRGSPTIAIYGKDFSDGRYLLVIDSENGEIIRSFDADLLNWPTSSYLPFEWAEVVDNILYVSNYYNGYSSSTQGQNAFITAIDMDNGKVLWRSKSLVSNANFVVVDNSIITGYGFTSEKDYIYVLKKSNGSVMQKVPVKTAPDWFVLDNNNLLVRTYDTDYIFKIERDN